MEFDENKYKELYVNGTTYRTHMCKKYPGVPKWDKPNLKMVDAFIPGTIRDIFVKKGQIVKKGDNLLILEAMKMRNRLKAPINGTIKSVKVSTNQLVSKNQLLVEFE